MFRIIIPLLAIALLAGCVKDRTFPVRTVVPGTATMAPGVLKVNEFVATGSQHVNEFGSAEDWFEIYNPNASSMHLVAGRWFVSDAGPSNPSKYELPELTIPGHGFLVIWCDNQNTVQTQVHTNFALSASGEHLVIYYDDGQDAFVVDDHQYGPQSISGASEGRSPDGSENWTVYTTPTPGAPNP